MKLIVDDNQDACSRLQSMLISEGLPSEEVLAEVQLGRARQLVSENEIELVFLDIEMPKMNGLDFLKLIRSDGYTGHVIITTSHNEYTLEALRAEALDYLLKPVVRDELQAALERFYSRRKAYEKNFDKLMDHGLTRRQVEIARRIFQGKTSAQIADELFLSKHTVDTHRRNILKQTGCKSTTELFRLL
ncbi:MAG: response regulator transcription factor [Flavobacteriales bacterium]|nr:response regulator transcription factor [Flavobacteriales bacterium]